MRRFGCGEEIAETLAGLGYPLALTQLEPGALRGDLHALRFVCLQVLRVHFNRALHIAGAKPADWQLFSLELNPAPQAGPLPWPTTRASRPSLMQGFQDHLGMVPMAFLKLQRLHGVRQSLLAADPKRTTIAAVAARFGFLSAGHFARDYRLLFGELSSLMLAAGPKSRAQAGRTRTNVHPRYSA